MKSGLMHAVLASAVMALAPASASAQHHKNVQLHVNPRWDECSFQLDPSLTQSAWHRFTQEAGLVAYFRPLSGARPMGKGRFEISALQYTTPVDDESSAWNDTFVHPDSTHWLYEGSGLTFPGLAGRVGVSERVDVGVYFAQNPNANYGFYGGQVQYNVLNDEARNWAASARASFVRMFGPEDLTLAVYGIDAVVSRDYVVSSRWLTVSPYVGASSYLSSAHERTSAVNLADERVTGTQAMIGASARVSFVRVGLEYSTAKVNSRAVKVAVAF